VCADVTRCVNGACTHAHTHTCTHAHMHTHTHMCRVRRFLLTKECGLTHLFCQKEKRNVSNETNKKMSHVSKETRKRGLKEMCQKRYMKKSLLTKETFLWRDKKVFHVSKEMSLLSKETFSRDVSFKKRDLSLEI